MKKILLIAAFLFSLVASMCLSSCSSNDKNNDLPMIYMEKPKYALGKESVAIRIKSEIVADRDIVVPFSFAAKDDEEGGKEGVDFTTKDKNFVIKAGESEGTITLTRIKENIEDNNKETLINLKSVPKGYVLGLMDYATIKLYGKAGNIMSFSDLESSLCYETPFFISLEKMKGGKYKAEADTKFELEVDPSSTAIEGEHFEFVDGRFAQVKRKKTEGYFTLKFLKKEEGKDNIIIRFKPKEGFCAGVVSSTTIKIDGPYNLNGKWSFDKIVNAENIAWGLSGEEKLPTGSQKDIIEFKGDSYKEYTFSCDIKSDFKNYFGEKTRTITFIGETLKDYQEEATTSCPKHNVLQYSFPDMNVNFSA